MAKKILAALYAKMYWFWISSNPGKYFPPGVRCMCECQYKVCMWAHTWRWCYTRRPDVTCSLRCSAGQILHSQEQSRKWAVQGIIWILHNNIQMSVLCPIWPGGDYWGLLFLKKSGQGQYLLNRHIILISLNLNNLYHTWMDDIFSYFNPL